jgi:[ribosomal protein S18]-alanine N-acetyltransferase
VTVVEEPAAVTTTDSRNAVAHVDLRPMGEADLDEVIRIEQSAGGLSWSRSLFAAELTDPDSRVWIVADAPAAHAGDGRRRIVGYGGAILLTDEAHIANVAVLPDQRRSGIGARLVSALLEESRARGATAATLEVRTGNIAARALYRRLGFVPVGTRPAYYTDTGEDAIIMWLHDLQDVVPLTGERR